MAYARRQNNREGRSSDSNWRIRGNEDSVQTNQQADCRSRHGERNQYYGRDGHRPHNRQDYPGQRHYFPPRDNTERGIENRQNDDSAPATSQENNQRHLRGPLCNDILPQAMQQLSEMLMSSDTRIPSYRGDCPRKLILPYARHNAEMSFVHHFGDVFHDEIRLSPKVMNYDYSESERQKTRSEVEATIRAMDDTVFDLIDQKHCLIDFEFLKLVFRDPKPCCTRESDQMPAVEMKRKFRAYSPEIPYSYHCMCFSDGEESLLDVLQRHGVVIQKKMEEPDEVRLETYAKGYKRQGLNGRIYLNSSDLSFKNWNAVRRSPCVSYLSNPGQVASREFQTDGGDLRMRGLVHLEVGKSDLEEMSQSSGVVMPSVFTSPNLGGVLERRDDDFQVMEEHSGILQLFSYTNGVKYVMNMDGAQFTMHVSDVICYQLDEFSKSLVKERTGKRWVKLKFPLPSRDRGEVNHHVSVLTDLAMKLMDALGSGELMPKIWSTNSIHRGVPTPSLVIQRIRRRIIENDDLAAMLDLRADASGSQFSECLHKLLADVEDGSVPLSAFEKNKLEEAGRQAGILE